MANSFVPFGLSSGLPKVPSARGASSTGTAPPEFKPATPSTLPSTKSVETPTPTPKLPTGVAGPAGATCRAHPGSAPKVSLERVGNLITQIRIECACGQVIELACTY
jgi:hypothetical protein